MPKLTVYDIQKAKVDEIDLSDEVFAAESRPHLYHPVVRELLVAKRQGTVKTKKRSEVAGSTRKVYRQKGTGNARHGDSRAPNFRRGGAVFGPQPRPWDVRVPRKLHKAALVSALSDRVREGHVLVLDRWASDEIRTRKVAEFLKRFDLGSALLVDVSNRSLSLSCRNLPTARYLSSKGLNLFDVLKYDHLVLTREAALAIEGALKP